MRRTPKSPGTSVGRQSPRSRKDGGLEERLAAVKAIRLTPSRPDAGVILRGALEDRSCFVVAAAAQLIADLELEELPSALSAAFRRFLVDPLTTDKGCRAKTAVVKALLRTGRHDAEVYRAGVRHVQKEPAWGPPVDTAPELRGQCALGLVRAKDPEAMVEVATLLADPEAAARTGAVQALAEVEAGVAVPLLRYKLLVGDPEPAVIAACYATLLALAPGPTLASAAGYLDTAPDAFAEAVALAMGESRLGGALSILRTWSQRVPRPTRQVAYVAVTLLRSDDAFDALLDIVSKDERTCAEDALRALANYRHDGRLKGRALDAAAHRQDDGIRRLAVELLGAA